jgi:hypothetical protein
MRLTNIQEYSAKRNIFGVLLAKEANFSLERHQVRQKAVSAQNMTSLCSLQGDGHKIGRKIDRKIGCRWPQDKFSLKAIGGYLYTVSARLGLPVRTFTGPPGFEKRPEEEGTA